MQSSPKIHADITLFINNRVLTEYILISLIYSGVSGYVSSSMYKKIGGQNWVWNIVLTATLFAGTLIA